MQLIALASIGSSVCTHVVLSANYLSLTRSMFCTLFLVFQLIPGFFQVRCRACALHLLACSCCTIYTGVLSFQIYVHTYCLYQIMCSSTAVLYRANFMEIASVSMLRMASPVLEVPAKRNSNIFVGPLHTNCCCAVFLAVL